MSENEKANCATCAKENCAAKGQRPDEQLEEFLERQELSQRLCKIKNKIMVLSGKGGVGKSSVSVNLASSLAMEGFTVGLLDIDIHGPSVPTMLNIADKKPAQTEDGIVPISIGSLKVMSIGLLLQNPNQAVIWRGPMKMGVIKQFLKDVAWGELDYLIIDAPPGTGDEPLSACQLIDDLDGGIVVTTPQDVASVDVRKSITFCRQLELPVIGVVENMSGFVCPKCGELTDIFKSGGGEKLAAEMKVPFLGKLPIDPDVAAAGDSGTPYVHSFKGTKTAEMFKEIVEKIIKTIEETNK